jgi:hypothetical protein
VQWEADAELEALWSSATLVPNLVLERLDMTSSSAALLSSMTELIKDRVDAAATNGVRWGARSVLAVSLSHFLELGTELELLGSRHNTNLTEDKVDALLAQAR